jgi:uncharacterized protein YbbC (DUF1343 family)
MAAVANGLDQFEKEQWKKYKGQKLGLLSNQASINHNLTNAKDVISGLLPGHLKVLFGPQHGFRGEDQDNMVETEDYIDPHLHIPVLSLYGNKMDRFTDILDTIDLLIIDLQDVGTRVYTFISTLLSCLKKTAVKGKHVLILDRPNPLGGIIVEGNLLRPELYSLVGPFAIPMRHGMTIGELAHLFNDAMKIDCPMTVISLKGWHRRMLWNDTGLRWIMPSPNMPLFETALVYPGQVLWEGTNISEGRGTCRPFEIFGAPFLNPPIIKKALTPKDIAGCYLQEYHFRPTFNKWNSKLCSGFMIHIINPNIYRPYRTSLALLKAIIDLHRDQFAWKDPPYEYEFTKLPIDLIFGDSSIRSALEAGKKVEELLKGFSKEVDGFLEFRKPYLVYKE